MKELDHYGTCPECGSNWDGGSILDTFIKQREEGSKHWQGKSDEDIKESILNSYSEPHRWSRLIGVEVRGRYDGISYWECPDCKTMWDRFTGKKVEHEI